MEPPISDDADALRTRPEGDEGDSARSALRPREGQYRRLPERARRRADSDTETYVALRLPGLVALAGVPFFIRAGKGLSATVNRAVVELKATPRPLFAERRLQAPPEPTCASA